MYPSAADLKTKICIFHFTILWMVKNWILNFNCREVVQWVIICLFVCLLVYLFIHRVNKILWTC